MEDTDKRIPTVEQWKVLASKIGMGGVKTLTKADYNYPTSSPVALQPWLLPQGVYVTGETMSIYSNTVDGQRSFPVGETIIVFNASCYIYSYGSGIYIGGGPAGYSVATRPINNLNSASAYDVLAANQGRILNNKLEGRITQNAGAPDTSTVGTVGLLLEDTTNGAIYVCTAADTTTPAYTWERIATGSGVKTLTEADYNYPVDNPSKVALWLLPAGFYLTGDVPCLIHTNWSTSENLVNSPVIVSRKSTTPFGLVSITTRLTSAGGLRSYVINPNTGVNQSMGDHLGNDSNNAILTTGSVADYLPTTSGGIVAFQPLSARQGKVLNDKIGGNLSTLTTTDKASLIAAINELVARVEALEGEA